MKPEDFSSATYATIDDLRAAVRSTLTLSRGKGAEMAKDVHEYDSPALDEHDLYAQLNKQSIKWISRMETK